MSAILIALFLLAAVFMPFAVIWAMNTLFGLQIPFTFFTWLAALVLAGALRGKIRFNWSR